jgi:hypothetical protein
MNAGIGFTALRRVGFGGKIKSERGLEGVQPSPEAGLLPSLDALKRKSFYPASVHPQLL